MNTHSLAHWVILIATSFASGCALFGVNPDDPAKVGSAVRTNSDPFKGSIHYWGPAVANQAIADEPAPTVEKISISARTDKSSETRYFVNVIDYYQGDWRGYDQAYDSSGEKFHALAVKHHAGCALFCSFEERLDIEVSKKYLEDHAKTGITMRLYGPFGGSAPFTLPAGYIQGFLRVTAAATQPSPIPATKRAITVP